MRSQRCLIGRSSQQVRNRVRTTGRLWLSKRRDSFHKPLAQVRAGVPMPTFTVDAIEPVTVDSRNNFNEIRTIQTLSVGLRKIADTLKSREMVLQQRVTDGK